MPAKCFGPYLRYAIATDFRNFARFHKTRRDFNLFLLVEFKKHANPKTFRDEINHALGPYSLVLGPVNNPAKHKTRYYTAHARKAAVGDAVAAIWDRHVSRVELSLPLEEAQAKAKVKDRAPLHALSQRVLIGVLDDGCPFAANRFLAATRDAETRVRAIWGQNPRHKPIEVRDRYGVDCLFGQKPTDFQYGCEFRRRSEPASKGSKKQMGLNEWIELHRTSAGSIDEDGCYADAGFDTLRFQELHGAHVMDVLAGPVPTSSRISLDRLQPPSFAPVVTDPASVVDIVFVQFPKDCIEDPTGVWLDGYILDGLRYILACAGSAYEKVVVNVSYGRTTGPNNGTALLEQALTELVTEFDGSAGHKPKLEISLAAGNYYLTDSHVVFVNDKAGTASFEWTWRLPPDNAALCFTEVWMNDADAAGVKVTLTSPTGEIFASTGPTALAGVEGPLPWGGGDTMWRLQVEATVIGADFPATVTNPIPAAEYGNYTIKVTGVRRNAQVHGYVARTDPNMDVLPGAKPSYFIDSNWESACAGAAGCTYVDGEFDDRGSFISRFGTLNGVATADTASIHVAGGYMLSNARKSPYSSAGPARGWPVALREGPDFAMLCDESYALQGIPAGGNRSGVVFRLIGTSTAAPQLARWITRLRLPKPDHPPKTHEGIEQRGRGDLTPP